MKFRIALIACLLPVLAEARTDAYRLSWRSDPATSMVVGWNQVSGTAPEVCYDTVDHGTKVKAYRFQRKPDNIVAYGEMSCHFARLDKLKPDTAYYFIIRDSEGASQRFWFKTASAKPQPFTFIAGGDSRSDHKSRRKGNKLVPMLRPAFILFGGDYTGGGKPHEWQKWLQDWQLTIAPDGRMTPIIPTHGNHENADMQMMGKLFDTPHPDQYYSLGIAGDLMRIWVLNSELEYKSPLKVPEQQTWIEQDLPEHADVKWKLAAYHRPMRPHTARKNEGPNRIKAWAKLFYDQGLDLVVESDTHMVKRTYPLRPFNGNGSHESFIRDDDKGIVFIGEGSWGAPIRPQDDDKPWTMASGSFHQFKWIQVFPDEILIRTVLFDGTNTISALTDNNLFIEPVGMSFWDPPSGKILRLPFDATHETFHDPAKP
jgi:hypothetical protein